MTSVTSTVPRTFTPSRLVLAVAFLAALLAVPFLADRYVVSVFILIFYFAYLGQAWNLMMGFAGQLSLGHALYVGLGAYVPALLWTNFGISPFLGVFAGIAVAMLFAAALGWLGFRFGIEGVYFALLTIAFSEFTRLAFDHLPWTGGAGGLFLPVRDAAHASSWQLDGGPLLFYFVTLGLAVAATLIAALLSRNRLGYEWRAVREDPFAAEALGINLFRAKMKAILLSSAMTAVAGVINAFYYRNLFPGQLFDISKSIELMLAPIVGGLGTVAGPIVGAFVLTPLGEALTSITHRLGIDAPGVKAVFYGLVLIAIIYFKPDGLWPWIAQRLRLGRQRP